VNIIVHYETLIAVDKDEFVSKIKIKLIKLVIKLYFIKKHISKDTQHGSYCTSDGALVVSIISSLFTTFLKQISIIIEEITHNTVDKLKLVFLH